MKSPALMQAVIDAARMIEDEGCDEHKALTAALTTLDAAPDWPDEEAVERAARAIYEAQDLSAGGTWGNPYFPASWAAHFRRMATAALLAAAREEPKP